jgi:hypothetical protein
MAIIKTKALRLAGVATLGAVLVEVVLVMSEGLGDAFTVARIPSHLTALLVGGLLGWMYELLRELSAATSASLQDISRLTDKISYQDQALSMLTRSPRHNEVLTRLIAASMKDNFRNIPYVGQGAYLEYLCNAIEHSSGFQGVQRRPLRWFREESASAYLHTLRDRTMAYKTRIFIIDDEDVEQMEQDLRDPDTLSYYWDNGGDVDSYWISVENYRRQFPGCRVPDDFGLYDGILLIAYDLDRQVLTFNLVRDTSQERQIFTNQRDLDRFRLTAYRPIPKAPIVTGPTTVAS